MTPLIDEHKGTKMFVCRYIHYVKTTTSIRTNKSHIRVHELLHPFDTTTEGHFTLHTVYICIRSRPMNSLDDSSLVIVNSYDTSTLSFRETRAARDKLQMR